MLNSKELISDLEKAANKIYRPRLKDLDKVYIYNVIQNVLIYLRMENSPKECACPDLNRGEKHHPMCAYSLTEG